MRAPRVYPLLIRRKTMPGPFTTRKALWVNESFPLVKSAWSIWENVYPMLLTRETSTLHISKGDILLHAKLIYEVYKLCLRQRLGENVHNLIICGYVLELYFSLLYHVLDEVIFYLNVLRPVIKYYIFWNLDTTLIITMY